MSRSSYPDVIPASESPRYEMGFLGPGHDAIREEDYTELGKPLDFLFVRVVKYATILCINLLPEVTFLARIRELWTCLPGPSPWSYLQDRMIEFAAQAKRKRRKWTQWDVCRPRMLLARCNFGSSSELGLSPRILPILRRHLFLCWYPSFPPTIIGQFLFHTLDSVWDCVEASHFVTRIVLLFKNLDFRYFRVLYALT